MRVSDAGTQGFQLQQRFALKLVQGDVDIAEWNDLTGNSDVVYCYGLLNHLEDPDPALSGYSRQFRRRELANLGADPDRSQLSQTLVRRAEQFLPAGGGSGAASCFPVATKHSRRFRNRRARGVEAVGIRPGGVKAAD